MSRFDAQFADYVTRVSFNLQLSKEMVTFMASVDHERRMDEVFGVNSSLESCARPNHPAYEHRFPRWGGSTVGCRGCISRGLVHWDDPGAQEPKWSRPAFTLTEAGEHVLALLKIAGLVHERVIPANDSKKPKTKGRKHG